MRRREVIAVLTALTVGARPGSACAQTGLKRVGVVYQGGPYEPSIEGLRDGLRAAGLEEGRHIALLLRNARGDVAAAEAAARALERDEKVDVIVAIGTTTARAAKRATAEVPIVFATGDRSGRGRVGREHRKARRTADRLSLLDQSISRRSGSKSCARSCRSFAASSPSTTRALRAPSTSLAARPRGGREARTLRWWRNRSPPRRDPRPSAHPGRRRGRRFLFRHRLPGHRPHAAGHRGGKRPTPAHHGDECQSRQDGRSCGLRA